MVMVDICEGTRSLWTVNQYILYFDFQMLQHSQSYLTLIICAMVKVFR